MDEAVTTAAWTDEEAEAFAIQPAKALALAAAPAGGNGCLIKKTKKKFSNDLIVRFIQGE